MVGDEPASEVIEPRGVSRRSVLALVALLAAWIVAAIQGGLDLSEMAAGALAVGIGVVASSGLRRRNATPRAAVVAGVADDAPVTGDPLAGLLTLLKRHLRADRLVVWRRHHDRGEFHPVVATGSAPPPIPAGGTPLAWALDQNHTMRVDPAPSWAESDVTAVPVPVPGEPMALTIETSAVGGTAGPAAEEAAALLAGVLEMHEREERAAATTARFERVVAFLKELPGDRDPREFPDDLARAAAEIVGGTGAVVASWDEEAGQVLGHSGIGGGPAPGHYIGVMGGDLAMAARAGATLRRAPDGNRSLPLAGAGERWTDRPGYTTIVPLVDALRRTRGVIGVWGDRGPDEAGVELLEALGPLLALQIQHSTDLVRFRQRAHEDALTGLPNRAALDDELEELRNRFHRYRRPVALMVLDIDHFKAINDEHGHQAGDAVLERLGDVLKSTVREVDFPARFGGEEMVVLMPETMRREAGEAAERIRAALEKASFEWNGLPIPVTVSIGVSTCPECVQDPEALLRSADQALYTSKRAGRNRVTVAAMATSGG